MLRLNCILGLYLAVFLHLWLPCYSFVAQYFNFRVLVFSFSSFHAFCFPSTSLCVLRHCVFLVFHRHPASQILSRKRLYLVTCLSHLLRYLQEWAVKLCSSPLTNTWKIRTRKMSLGTAGVSLTSEAVFRGGYHADLLHLHELSDIFCWVIFFFV